MLPALSILYFSPQYPKPGRGRQLQGTLQAGLLELAECLTGPTEQALTTRNLSAGVREELTNFFLLRRGLG